MTLPCGCSDHKEKLCPEWEGMINRLVAKWHMGQGGHGHTLQEYLYDILGITEKMYAEWVESGTIDQYNIFLEKDK